MSDCIAIPVKRFRDAKTRLAGFLSPVERGRFTASMFHDVLIASGSTYGVERVLVITPDEAAASLARDEDAEVLHESQSNGLNQAARIVIDDALRRKIERLLIVHADVPLLRPDDLSQFFTGNAKVIIAPSRGLDGTNALLLSPPNAIQPRYGRMSYDTHLNAARKRGIEPSVIRNERIALDIDTPIDLKFLCSLSPGGFTGEFLREHNLTERIQAMIRESPLSSRLALGRSTMAQETSR